MTACSKHTVMPSISCGKIVPHEKPNAILHLGCRLNPTKCLSMASPEPSCPQWNVYQSRLCPYPNKLPVSKVTVSDSMTPQAWVPVRLQLFHALFVCFHIYLEVCVYCCSHCVCLFKSWHWRHYYLGLKNAPLYQDTWSCFHDRDDIPTWLLPKKNIVTSWDTYWSTTSFQPRSYAFIWLPTETWIPLKPSQFHVK